MDPASGHVERAKERMRERIMTDSSTSILQIYKEAVLEIKNSIGIYNFYHTMKTSKNTQYTYKLNTLHKNINIVLDDADARELFTTMMPSFASMKHLMQIWRRETVTRNSNKIAKIKGYLSYEGEIIKYY